MPPKKKYHVGGKFLWDIKNPPPSFGVKNFTVFCGDKNSEFRAQNLPHQKKVVTKQKKKSPKKIRANCQKFSLVSPFLEMCCHK